VGNLRLFIRANDRLFINGAVLRMDRKVSVELLNDATFLLENHVMHKQDATTPLRQLYFTVQLLLIDPINAEGTKKLFKQILNNLLITLDNQILIQGVKQVDVDVSTGQVFMALRRIRELYKTEAMVLQPVSVDMDDPASLKLLGGV